MRILTGILLLAQLAGCAGNRFGQLPNQKKSAKADTAAPPEKQDNADAQGTTSDSDDRADQPVQITGSYLTCEETQRPTPSQAIFGCKIAQPDTRAPIDLKAVAEIVSWSYTMPAGAAGGVAVAPQADGAAWHVLYDLAASNAGELEALISAVNVAYDIVLKPENAVNGQTHLSNTTPLATLLGRPSSYNNAGLPPIAPGPVLDTSSNVPDSDGVAPVNAPTVRFMLEPRGQSYALRAALDDATDVSELNFTGGGAVGLVNATMTEGGGARLNWSVAMRVSLKKGGRICVGDAMIGPGALNLPTSCQ